MDVTQHDRPLGLADRLQFVPALLVLLLVVMHDLRSFSREDGLLLIGSAIATLASVLLNGTAATVLALVFFMGLVLVHEIFSYHI